MKPFNLTRLGNPILRTTTRRLTRDEILSDEIQAFIRRLKFTGEHENYSVGLSANQVGESLAISLVAIKPTPTRPSLERFEAVLVNPEIVETFGRRRLMWEGCMSCGTGDDILYGRVPRYQKIRLRWLDEKATAHDEILEGFAAHVAQHEVDHINGRFFLDVARRDSLMMGDEYKKRIMKK
jgi:peptide deformylase